MAQLLLELFSEEIPARMQAKAEADLASAIGAKLNDAGLAPSSVTACSGPRRLIVVCDGVPAKSEDVREERKGPKVGAPDKAVEGFMRAAGLTSIDQADIRTEGKKGEIYVAIIEKPGEQATDIISRIVPEIIRGFHWPKSMRWGTGDLRWVRPLQRILCVYDGKPVNFNVDGIEASNITEGHRVHGRGPYTVTGWQDYKLQLEGDGHVLLTREQRREKIAQDAKSICADAGLELVDDIGLLEEVTGLAEWPVVLMGEMDPGFLDLPPEVIRLSMRTHQKYFAVRDPKTGDLAPKFVVVANVDAKDGGKQIAAGNAKVLSARLEDARFFWNNDKATGLEAMAPKLATIDFKKELGSIADKVERVAALARELAPVVGADPDLVETAARLCKADLVSEMVYEFPELQGVMGRYYALEAPSPSQSEASSDRAPPSPDGRGITTAGGGNTSARAGEGLLRTLSNDDRKAVANAIADHYKPQGPSDDVPSAPVSVAVALADKLDTLVGFWAIDEKPTGSKDPFALRRAALGVIRIELENELQLNLRYFIESWFKRKGHAEYEEYASEADHLQMFFEDRLEVALKDRGVNHDIIAAAIDGAHTLANRGAVSFSHARVAKLARALQSFLETDDGANLLAGYKRAANILKSEEKKDGTDHSGTVKEQLLQEQAERDLFAALTASQTKAARELDHEEFEGAMAALSELRQPIDTFFEAVIVNDDDVDVRQNRLYLLSQIRHALHTVADFSKIEG